MNNKNVGYLLLGISIVIVFIIFLFNSALKQIINSSCTMAGHASCTMTQELSKQTYLALGIVAILILVSLFLVFSRPEEKILIRRIKENNKKTNLDVSSLKPEEKQVIKIVQENKAIFQADLIEKTSLGKAKMSRILDKLEARGFVERKRRGMNNIVVLK